MSSARSVAERPAGGGPARRSRFRTYRWSSTAYGSYSFGIPTISRLIRSTQEGHAAFAGKTTAMPGTWGRRAAAITGLFLFALLPAACGRSAGTGGPAVRFDVAADPATLLPLFAHVDAGNVEAQLAHLCFEPFFDLDASGQPVP